MATTKVSDLTALTSADNADLLLITDSSLGQSKKITVGNLITTPISTAVSALVDSAPATLDTLNELAAALGDDANFSTTVTTSIGTKWTQDNTKITNWDTAYGWGDHSAAGYLTSFTETDPVYTASSWYTTTNNSTNWDTAYGWGNHASAGYITGNQTITLSGDATGSGTTSITVTVADDSHNHIISNVDGLQTALDGKAATNGNAANNFSAATLNATTVDLGNWTITESAGVLYFATGGTNKMKLDASGNLTCVGNVTAYGTM
jgi:hypothetical protein